MGPVHASVVSVHRAVPVEIGGCGSGVLINNRVVLPPTAPIKKTSTVAATPSYYVSSLPDDEEGKGSFRLTVNLLRQATVAVHCSNNRNFSNYLQ